MNDLKNIPTKDLEKELQRREAEKTKPQKLAFLNFEKVINQCEKYIEVIAHNGVIYSESDFEHYIFKYAIEAVYGEDVCKWINKRLRKE